MTAPTESTEGMVATSHPEATRVGLEVLRARGNAIDAAIAANAALGVIEPHMCGIGGDLMAMVWDPKSERLTGYNGSGCSPALLTLETFERQGLDHIPMRHPLTWTVPGCVMGWAHLLERFGTRSLEDLLRPAIRLAEEGCRVPPVIASLWHSEPLEPWEEARRVFLPGGHPPKAGDVFRNPDLARTYRQLAANWEVFYRGEIAQQVGAFCQTHGGVLSEQDLAEFGGGTWVWDQPECREFFGNIFDKIERPGVVTREHIIAISERELLREGRLLLTTRYRGHDIFALPPNTQGLSVLEMLNMLEREDLGSLGWGTTETLHRMLEAKKLAYEDRARHIADPDHWMPLGNQRLPFDEHMQMAEEHMGNRVLFDHLISKHHAQRRWSLFDPDRALESIPDDPVDRSDTTYLCAVDESGMAVSLIQSIYKAWGSGAVPDGLGFCLQNRGWGFVLDPDHPNCVGPLKRPLHTIIPGFAMRDGKPWLCFGVMGGPMQPQGQVQILTNMIDLGMDVQAAGEAPRWRHDGARGQDNLPLRDGGEVSLELGFSDGARAGLRARGHRVTDWSNQFGGFQGIMFDHERGVLLGGSDPRKDGCARGLSG